MSKEKTHMDWDTMVHVQEMANLRAENTRYRECFEALVRHTEWGSDLDGGDFQDTLENHGVFVRVPATEDECAEWDMEYGHPLSVVYVLAWSERGKGG